MGLRHYAHEVRSRIRLQAFALQAFGKNRYQCPVCAYKGPFKDIHPPTGLRRHAQCPRCHALERHRIQYVALIHALNGMDTSAQRALHVAPEPFFRKLLSERFGHYETADLSMPGVDHHVDLQALPFADQSYDFVFASHVLEHVPDDHKALSEIRRILKPKGMAILPVPLVARETIEYPEPNPFEAYHVRAPGLDYFDRYEKHFSRVERIDSESLPDMYQPFVYEDRSRWPTPECPLRQPMPGERHVDVVPVMLECDVEHPRSAFGASPKGAEPGHERSGGPFVPGEGPGHWPGAACKAPPADRQSRIRGVRLGMPPVSCVVGGAQRHGHSEAAVRAISLPISA